MTTAQPDNENMNRSQMSLNPFRGRCSRHMFLFCLTTHLTIAWFVFRSIGDEGYALFIEKIGWGLAAITASAFLIAIPAVARRLHDIGFTGKWAWLVVTPAQPLLLLALLYWPSTRLSNSHGGVPRDFIQQIAWLASGAKRVFTVAKRVFTVQTAGQLFGLRESPRGPSVRVIAARYLIIGLSIVVTWVVNENFVTISSFWNPPAILLVGGALFFWGLYCWLVAPYRREKLTGASNDQAVTTELAVSAELSSQLDPPTGTNDGPSSGPLTTKVPKHVQKSRPTAGKPRTFLGSVAITAVLIFVFLSSPYRISGALTSTALGIPSAAQGSIVGAGTGAFLGLTLGSVAAPAGAAASLGGTITGAVLGGTAGAVVGFARDRFQQNVGANYSMLRDMAAQENPNLWMAEGYWHTGFRWDRYKYRFRAGRLFGDEKTLRGLSATAGVTSTSLDIILSSLLAGNLVPGHERYIQRISNHINDHLLRYNPEVIDAAGNAYVEWGWLAN